MPLKYLLSPKNWNGVAKKITRAGQVLLFSDYDGTLVPIKSHPSRAKLPFRTKSVLKKLSNSPGIAVCIISGRPLEEIKRVVGLAKITYVGNHGFEIETGSRKIGIPAGGRTKRSLASLCDRLRPLSRKFPGFWVENKGLTASLHYRQMPSQKVKGLLREIKTILTPLSERFVVTAGKKVREIRPAVKRDKAWAVGYLTALSNTRLRLLIYLGDDQTDFKALSLVQQKSGIAVKVGSNGPAIKGVYKLNTPGEVYSFLARLPGLFGRKVKRVNSRG